MTRDEQQLARLLKEAKRFGRLAERFVGAAPREGQSRRAERDEAVMALRDAEKLLIGIVEHERRAAISKPATVAAPPADLVATCEWSEDANGEQSAACLAGAEALRRIEAYDKAWDAYETSPHGGTFTAMMNARAEMFALLATETTRGAR